MPTIPDRQALRALFDEAVSEINATRTTVDLTNPFYAETGNSVFEAGYLALLDYCGGTKARVHTLSAPAGGGKTSFAYAFMIAVTRYAEDHPEAPYGCIFAVDQITKAEEAFKELDALMPGKVAVWTSDHDKNRKPKDRKKVPEPAALFKQDELRLYPIIVVTHSFYNGRLGNKAHLVVRNGQLHNSRGIVFVDERPEEVTVFETTLKDALVVIDALTEKRPDIKEHLGHLKLFLMPFDFANETNQIIRPHAPFGTPLVGEILEWFTTEEAAAIVRSNTADTTKGSGITGLEQLFGVAKALTQGRVFTVPTSQVVHFVGWQEKHMVRSGMVLLDATADIDGVSLVSPFRLHVAVPKARYDNLEIIHVPQHTEVRLSTYLETAAHQYAYADWMVQTIKEHMAPGEKGLVVCKQKLLKEQRVPPWPSKDSRFDDPKSYTEGYAWDIDGRKLCVAHWGTGIGSNLWQDADVVFLFDEFHIPRRIAAATVQGLKGHRADQGALASMSTLNSRSQLVDLISDGHRLRWTKQLALRGKGRSYDAHGVCGKQRLVVSCDLRSFTANADMLFPGAKIRVCGGFTESTPWADKALHVLSKDETQAAVVLTTKDLAKLLGKPWRSISSNILTPAFKRSIGSLGWRYVSTRGRGGARFERIKSEQSLMPQGEPEDYTAPLEIALCGSEGPVVTSGGALGVNAMNLL